MKSCFFLAGGGFFLSDFFRLSEFVDLFVCGPEDAVRENFSSLPSAPPTVHFLRPRPVACFRPRLLRPRAVFWRSLGESDPSKQLFFSILTSEHPPPFDFPFSRTQPPRDLARVRFPAVTFYFSRPSPLLPYSPGCLSILVSRSQQAVFFYFVSPGFYLEGLCATFPPVFPVVDKANFLSPLFLTPLRLLSPPPKATLFCFSLIFAVTVLRLLFSPSRKLKKTFAL